MFEGGQGQHRRSKMAWKGRLAETRARVEAGPLAWWVWLASSQPPKSESCVTGNKLLPPLASTLREAWE